MPDEVTDDRPDLGSESATPPAPPETSGGDDAVDELDLSALERECARIVPDDMPTGRKAAMSRSAKAFYRTQVITGEPSLKAIAEYLRDVPKGDVLNIQGIGEAGYDALFSHLLSEPDAEPEDPDDPPAAEASPSDAPVRTLDRSEDARDTVRTLDRQPANGTDPDLLEEDASVSPVRRRYSTSTDAPTCDECGSGMRVSKTIRKKANNHPFQTHVTRYYQCLADPDHPSSIRTSIER